MRRLIAFILSATLAAPVWPQAAEASACQGMGFAVGFFNGVWNTQQDAAAGADKLRQLIGTRHRASDSGKDEPVQVEVMYNTTGAQIGSIFLQDVAEVFAQRSTDINIDLSQRWELFWDVVSGDRSGAWDVLQQVAGMPALTASLFDAVRAKTISNLALMSSSPPTEADTARHRTRIKALVSERQKLVFVAHSQGNLFLNRAYEAALSVPTPDGGKITGDNIKAVHIAPASTTLKGPYTVANIDLVISALRLTPGSVPGINLELAPSSRDFSGHGLENTYLDASRPGKARIASQLLSVFDTVVTPKTKANAAFFTASLMYSGLGSIDLYVLEPNGRQVVVEKDQDGPEGVKFGPIESDYYRASCDPNQLQRGTYRLAFDNVLWTATTEIFLQISSALGGDLLYEKVDDTLVREPFGRLRLLLSVVVAEDKDGKLQATIKR